ncbi:YcxB family protein [Carboxylicivirga sp. RSCT41]|uniref:YcxB family protein n=1 Tax=Carboxylicivirga agarovorans TaxID=3417570 RepID=UPI003D328F8B
MTIKTHIDFKEYVKLMYILTYRKGAFIFTGLLGVFLFTISMLYFTGSLETDTPPAMAITMSIIFLFLLPFSVYFGAKKNYYSHGRLQEEISYEITEDLIAIKGETFTTEMSWDKTYRVLELKNWLLIYENKMMANIIPKRSIDNMDKLRGIIRNQSIKQKLKRS